jgi:hypothetical protein
VPKKKSVRRAMKMTGRWMLMVEMEMMTFLKKQQLMMIKKEGQEIA